MKPSIDLGRGLRAAGFSLLECVVYISVLMIILVLGMEAYYRTDKAARAVAGNASDILGVVNAGERWRRDVRRATAPVRVESTPDGFLCRIPQPDGEVEYSRRGEGVWRRAPGGKSPELVVTRVVDSRVIEEPRNPVPALRWELELRPQGAGGKLRPLFSFLVPVPAVPGSRSAP
ncbi:MAG TPA: hypothetical protein DCM86_06270 [Verrucomicrobiales bacterium]|nr:hypothetical protein [Verrucomicrobiales bacterium]